MERYNQLPVLRAKLEEKKQLLGQLEKSKGKISEDRFEQMSQRYRDQIETLSEQVASLEEEAKEQRVELQTRKELLESQLEQARAEFEEHQVLHEQGAINEDQFKSQKSQWRSTQKELTSKVKKIDAELDELGFYLTHKGEESYQKHRTKQQANELKDTALSGVNTLKEGAGKLLTPKRILGALAGLLVVAAIGVGVLYVVTGFESQELRDARALMEQGNYQLATVKLEQELQANPENTTAHFLMGQASLELDDRELAKSSFDQVILAKPTRSGEVAQQYFKHSREVIKDQPIKALEYLLVGLDVDESQVGAQEDIITAAIDRMSSQEQYLESIKWSKKIGKMFPDIGNQPSLILYNNCEPIINSFLKSENYEEIEYLLRVGKNELKPIKDCISKFDLADSKTVLEIHLKADQQNSNLIQKLLEKNYSIISTKIKETGNSTPSKFMGGIMGVDRETRMLLIDIMKIISRNLQKIEVNLFPRIDGLLTEDNMVMISKEKDQNDTFYEYVFIVKQEDFLNNEIIKDLSQYYHEMKSNDMNHIYYEHDRLGMVDMGTYRDDITDVSFNLINLNGILFDFDLDTYLKSDVDKIVEDIQNTNKRNEGVGTELLHNEEELQKILLDNDLGILIESFVPFNNR